MIEDNGTNETHYIIGHDVLTQAGSSLRYFVYDGHGSTRQLVEDNEDVTDAFSYDGYGMMLGGDPNRADPTPRSLLCIAQF